MLHVATKSVAACTVEVILPYDVMQTAKSQRYGFYRYCGETESDEVRDLGAPPTTGEMDLLGNRPVIHSNVVGDVTYGTYTERVDGGSIGTRDVILHIPDSIDNRVAGVYYCTYSPMHVQGTASVNPRYDSSYSYCRITCSISGNATSITVTVKVDVGPYTHPRTGKVERSLSGYTSVVLTRGQFFGQAWSPCGRISKTDSQTGTKVRCAWPRTVASHDVLYSESVIGGFWPTISMIQLQHVFLAASRITIGDSKAMLDAFQGMRLASFNGLAFTKDTSRLIRDTSQLIRDIKGVRKDPKRLASIWLSYRYGHRLYYKDCQTIRKAVVDSSKRRPLKFRGKHTEYLELFPGQVTRVEYNFTLYVSSSCLTDLSFVAAIRSLDFWPSAENLWDLVPYSFVADWFLNITDLCKRYDASLDILKFPIRGALQSVKISTETVSNHSAGSGNATVTLYLRTPLTPATLSTTLLSASLSLADGISLLHTADALALAISRRR